MNEPWMPRNLGGTIYYDPRKELAYYARLGQTLHESHVAVPIKTLQAAADIRECSARTMVDGDEDGPLDPPIEIICRKPRGHDYDHYNGYMHWKVDT